MTLLRERWADASFYSCWRFRRFDLLVLLPLLIAVGAVAHANEREVRGRFNVTVQVVNAGWAAAIPKSVSRTLNGPSMNQLKFGINPRAGYLVRFQIVDPAVEEVEIHGLGPVIRISSGAKDVFVPSGPSETISYRVKIRPGSEPTAAATVRATLMP